MPHCPRTHSQPPVIVSQERGYREGYARADLADTRGHHDWKAGVDGIFDPVHEALSYSITDPSQFEGRAHFTIHISAARNVGFGAILLCPGRMHYGNWTSAPEYGWIIRLQRQRMGGKPRLGVSRFVSSWNLLLHASYDRVFQTPALENLLLAIQPI